MEVAHGSGTDNSAPERGSDAGTSLRGPAGRGPAPPEDRLTTIIPAVTDGTPPDLRDPIEAVKAALDGAPREREQALSAGGPPPEKRRGQDHPEPDEHPPSGHARPGGADILDALRQDLARLNWRWVRRALYITAVVVLVLPIITFAMAYFIVDIPRPGDIRTNQVSTILASDGSELAKIVPPEGNRVDISLGQVPMHVRNAVLAAEDRNFYSNPGFSFSGFARAVKNNVFGGETQGGSTITQQYVKNALVGSQRAGLAGLVRKAKELVIATKMSGPWSKDDVLEAYLNIIYFG
ncbi:MAG: transglycosylase domain-containing protein, partial [Mycobacterium sp.]